MNVQGLKLSLPTGGQYNSVTSPPISDSLVTHQDFIVALPLTSQFSRAQSRKIHINTKFTSIKGIVFLFTITLIPGRQMILWRKFTYVGNK